MTNPFFLGYLVGLAMGAPAGLWLGFKLWKQSYTSITNVRRWHG
jgi:hypothetical protein